MRNPDRIDSIMKILTELWKAHPDWRLCQLINNAADSHKREIEGLLTWDDDDLFYLEDAELLTGLKILWEDHLESETKI